MNASQFMDKQIMGLSGTQSSDFLELLNPQEDHQSNGGAGKKEEILPSYDFQPIRTTLGSSSPPVNLDGDRAWGSADSKISPSNFRNYGSLGPHESSKVFQEKGRDAYDMVTVAEIDCTVKKYADNLLHALEGVSSRLSQLEGRTRHLESAVDDLKISIGNNSGSTDGKLRQLENILREVQTGVLVLRDKQEIAEAQRQLAKLQSSKGEHQPLENSNPTPPDSRQQPVPPQQPLHQPPQTLVAPPPPQLPASPASYAPLPPPPPQLPALPATPAPNAPPPPPPHQNPPPIPFPSQLPQTQIPSIPSLPPREPYFPPPGQSPETTQQHYQPSPQLPPPQHYQPPPQLPQYSQPPPQPSQPTNTPLQHQPSLPHHHEESSPYKPPPQTYPPSIRQPPQLPSGPPASQQFYGSNTSMYEPPTSRPSSGQLSLPTGYGPPSGPSFSDSFPYSGGSPRYNSSAMKPSPFSSSAPSGGGNYLRLPTAQILPQAPPAGSGSGGSTGNTGNRVPIDDVVDKVTTMGFPRELVRATVRKLTENGQSVDLNVVLDKLMNDSENQPPKGWFGR